MHSFLVKLSAFLGLQAGLLVAVFSLAHKSPADGYLSSIVDKHARLENTVPPRIIFVSGSSFAFGLDSSRIRQALGRTVVNLGLHAGLGANFIINDVPAQALGQGDLVVVSLEYEHFGADQLDNNVVYEALRSRPSSLWSLDLKEFFDNGLILLARHIRREVDLEFRRSGSKACGEKQSTLHDETSVYSRRAFNSDGDVFRHWDAPVPEMELKRRLDEASIRGSLNCSSSVLETVICRLNRFAQVCSERGATVVFVYPALAEPVFKANQATIERIDEALRHKIKIPVFRSPQAGMAPTRYFFDTPYHLNRAGVAWQTMELVKLLRQEAVNEQGDHRDCPSLLPP